MKVNIIAVDKIKESFLIDGINEFIKQLRPFTDLNIIEIADERIPAKLSDTEVQQVKKLKEKE